MFSSIAVIDTAPLFDGGRAGAGSERALAAALRSHGGCTATGFPGAAGLDRRMEQLASFFAMDEEAKLTCAIAHHRPANPNRYRGFYPFSPESGWAGWGRREMFDIGPEPPLACPDGPGAAAFREANAWPAMEPAAGWRRAMLALLDDQRALAMALMAAIGRGLGLGPERLLAPARGRNATLRLLHYAPRPARGGPAGGEVGGAVGDGRRVIARRHVDSGLLSLIWQDDGGGLQMQGPDGVWREAPPGLSVHCGDLMEPLTGGRLTGTPHRAAGGAGERFSAGFFLEPDFATEAVAGTSYARHLAALFPGRFDPPLAA